MFIYKITDKLILLVHLILHSMKVLSIMSWQSAVYCGVGRCFNSRRNQTKDRQLILVTVLWGKLGYHLHWYRSVGGIVFATAGHSSGHVELKPFAKGLALSPCHILNSCYPFGLILWGAILINHRKQAQLTNVLNGWSLFYHTVVGTAIILQSPYERLERFSTDAQC